MRRFVVTLTLAALSLPLAVAQSSSGTAPKSQPARQSQTDTAKKKQHRKKKKHQKKAMHRKQKQAPAGQTS